MVECKKNFFLLLDALNVIISICSLFEDKNQSRVFETMKVIRTFRLINSGNQAFQHMQLITNSLVNSLPNVFKLLIFFTIFLFIFSLFAMKYLKGALYKCIEIHGEEIQIENKSECFDYGGYWMNSDYNYDNILKSFFTLFVISSSEGWSNLMFFVFLF